MYGRTGLSWFLFFPYYHSFDPYISGEQVFFTRKRELFGFLLLLFITTFLNRLNTIIALTDLIIKFTKRLEGHRPKEKSRKLHRQHRLNMLKNIYSTSDSC